MPRDAVGHVNRIGAPEMDIVRRLYIVANEAWVTIVFCFRQCRLVRTFRYLRRLCGKGLMLEDSRNIAYMLPVDGAEIEILITEPTNNLLRPIVPARSPSMGPRLSSVAGVSSLVTLSNVNVIPEKEKRWATVKLESQPPD